LGVHVRRSTALAVLGLIWLVAATGGYTVSAFSGQTASAGNTFTAAPSFAPAFVKQLGTATCGGAASSITVPGGGVAAGNTVVVVVVLRGAATAGPVTVTDTRGNAYVVDVDFTNSNIRKVILSGRAATALQAGDALTVTHPDDDAEAVAALEFSGIREPRLDTAAADGGLSAAPLVTATTGNDNDLLVGAVGNVGNRSYTEATAWTTVADVPTNCGGGTGRLTLHAAYRLVSSVGSWAYNPTLNANDRWAAGIAAYRG
jgi:hypothetical protein